jgi:hypothetical protein
VYQSDTEIIFPMRVAPHLSTLRGDLWRELVDRVSSQPDASLEQLAFTLMIVRLSSCLTCHTDSYRAMRGCTICATQVIRRFRGDDTELLKLFETARLDVEEHMANQNEFNRDVLVTLDGGID